MLTKFNKISYIYLSIFAFFLLLSSLTPLTGDDWTWKSYIGIKRLESFFENYNGRYISNILELIFVRFTFVRILAMAIGSTLLIYYMYKISTIKKNPIFMLYILVLVLLMPLSVFKQTLGWTAGYVNYVISVVIMLSFIRLYTKETLTKLNFLKIIFYFLFSIIAMLVVEHVTLYLLFISFLINTFYYVKNKKLNGLYFVILIGHLIGSLIMFTNEAYISSITGKNDYQKLNNHDNIFTSAIKVFNDEMTLYFFTHNGLLLSLLTILLITITKLVNKNKKVNVLICSVFIISIIVSIFFNQFKYINSLNNVIPSTLLICSLISLTIFIVINFKGTLYYNRLLFYVFSMIILTLPFLVISPYGGRCTFASLIFFVMIIIDMSQFILNILETKDIHMNMYIQKYVNTSIIILIVLLYIIPLSFNKYTEISRDNYLNNLDNYDKVIKIDQIPFKSYHHMPDPVEGIYMTKFYKTLHGVPEETKLLPK
ncbi:MULTISPECIES: DUF6056 family protein [Mammaliicoccus]|uniref:DUF6056 family protein n=1 Tax=Mammaliicoccus TaxID=2803850 RepID=UPI0011CB5A6A|nr:MULTISPECIES: DUF6056 family protein [Mammaliicoccus]MEB8093518.1 DUF6056 family protein [Mammaliicoccus lentus]